MKYKESNTYPVKRIIVYGVYHWSARHKDPRVALPNLNLKRISELCALQMYNWVDHPQTQESHYDVNARQHILQGLVFERPQFDESWSHTASKRTTASRTSECDNESSFPWRSRKEQ